VKTAFKDGAGANMKVIRTFMAKMKAKNDKAAKEAQKGVDLKESKEEFQSVPRETTVGTVRRAISALASSYQRA
jgi:hypothetical protein